MPTKTDRETLLPEGRQTVTGLALAAAIIAAWGIAHVYGVVFYEWSALSVLTAPLLAGLLCWLYVGMFIVAHDCMHGSLAPGWPRLNRAIGSVFVFMYAGFDFDALRRAHFEHHRHSGTDGDPDFDPRPPHAFGRWYLGFMQRYSSWRQPAFYTAVIVFYVAVVGAEVANIAAFIVLPAIASSLQLFYFGTYLPHRPVSDPFADEHRARSSALGWWASLISCFHFGYHHEHHAFMNVPWWRLPTIHARERAR